MSHTRIKTKYYETVDAYGTVQEKTVYADFNNSCDIVTFYDDDGNSILSVEDVMKDNLLEAIIKLYEGSADDFERWKTDELKK